MVAVFGAKAEVEQEEIVGMGTGRLFALGREQPRSTTPAAGAPRN